MKGENKQLSVLHDLSQAIIGASSMEDVCNLILERTVKVLGVAKASVMKFDPVDRALKIVAAKGLPKEIVESARVKIGEGISGKVFKNNKPVLIKDIKVSGFESRKHYRSRSLMSAPVTCLPMNVSGKPIGVINVTDKKGGKHFSPDDLKLLTTIANQTAAYLHLCDLANDARDSEHMKRELDLAREMQQRLLPQRMPKVEGYDIAGKCLTAEHVGGDYFDFILGGARPPSVVLADVSGHSVGAAMLMSAFRSAIRSEGATLFLSPALISERLNALLYEDLFASEQFISMVYLQLLPDSIRYTTAGHWAPLLFQKGKFLNYSTEDTLLGVDKYTEFHEKRLAAQKGDIVVIFTDGLVEAQNKAHEHFGLKRVKAYISSQKNRRAMDICEGLCDEVKEFTGHRPLRDDVTVVTIKIL